MDGAVGDSCDAPRANCESSSAVTSSSRTRANRGPTCRRCYCAYASSVPGARSTAGNHRTHHSPTVIPDRPRLEWQGAGINACSVVGTRGANLSPLNPQVHRVIDLGTGHPAVGGLGVERLSPHVEFVDLLEPGELVRRDKARNAQGDEVHSGRRRVDLRRRRKPQTPTADPDERLTKLLAATGPVRGPPDRSSALAAVISAGRRPGGGRCVCRRGREVGGWRSSAVVCICLWGG